jgi:spore coat polysaccharide biosynthesis protein SpsF
MGSTRLPGKVVADVGGRPMLGLMLARLRGAPVDALVVATSDAAADDAVVAVAEAAGVPVVRGPEADVLGRFQIALDAFPADAVVRLTADCPLADEDVVAAALDRHQVTAADYTSNTLVRTFPDGLDTEVVSAAALREAGAEAVDPVEREHVTPFVYRRPERYRLAAFTSGEQLGEERWTVDTADDLDRLRLIVSRLDDPVRAGWRDVLAVAGRRPPAPREALTLEPDVNAEDPGRRAWVAFRDGREVGRVAVAVRDGIGSVTTDVPSRDRKDVLALLGSALMADAQVRHHDLGD